VYARYVPDTELLARRWLQLDSAYCAGAGVITLALCVPLARWFEIPLAFTAGLGVATLAWALLLMRLARSLYWRRPLRMVAGANAVASVGIAGLVVLAPDLPARLLLIAVAAEVAAFSAVQLRTLRRAGDVARA
jgi:hypothetical protein